MTGVRKVVVIRGVLRKAEVIHVPEPLCILPQGVAPPLLGKAERGQRKGDSQKKKRHDTLCDKCHDNLLWLDVKIHTVNVDLDIGKELLREEMTKCRAYGTEGRI